MLRICYRGPKHTRHHLFLLLIFWISIFWTPTGSICRLLFQIFVSPLSMYPALGCFCSDSKDMKNFVIHILRLSGESRVGTQNNVKMVWKKEQVVLDLTVVRDAARVRVAGYNWQVIISQDLHGLNGLIGAKQGRGRLYDSLAQMWSREDGGHEVFQLSVPDIKNAETI